ncbi:MAG: rhodanese-like domain-containing protein, partial [bacterium]
DAETPLIVNCAGRTRSIIGTQTLRRLGVEGPRALRNGGMGIMLAGLPLEEGTPSDVPAPSARSREYGEELAARLAAEEGIPSLSAEEVRDLLARADRETLYLLDVRLEPEHRAGRIPGAISIPGGQAVQRTDEVVAVRAGRVVTCCDNSARAIMAAYWLRRMGLPNVFHLRGGTRAWEAAGMALTASAAAAEGESPGLGGEEPLGLAEARAAAEGLAPGEAEARVGGGAAVLDVDLSRSFREGHLPGARWVSRARLEDWAAAHLPDPDAPLLLTCRDGRMAALAARALGEMGRRRVAFLDGGKRAWAAAGLPLEAGEEGIEGAPRDVTLKPYDIGREAMIEYLAWEEELGKKYER